MYEARNYRNAHLSNLVDSFVVSYMESDLWIGIDRAKFNTGMPDFAKQTISELRKVLLGYNSHNPAFFSSLKPLAYDYEAPPAVQQMLRAGTRSGTGPMSSVAGLFARHLAECLSSEYELDNVIIENGGDNYLLTGDIEVEMPVYAGKSPVSNKIGLRIKPGETPLGICTSSGSVGHSFSMGRADAVTVVARDIVLADAYATAICNSIRKQDDIDKALAQTDNIPEIEACIIILGENVGVKSNHEVVFYSRVPDAQNC